MMYIVAKNIKRIIDERGLKQISVAKHSKIKESTFNNMLNGRKIITAKDIHAIATTLDVSPNELFEQTEDSA